MAENNYGDISRLSIKTRLDRGKTVLEDVYFTAPFSVKSPFYPRDKAGVMQLMPLAASAGLLDGDEQEIEIDIGRGCNVEILSQSFEKVFKAEGGGARRLCRINTGRDSRLVYSPLPVIPHAGSRFGGKTVINIERGSRLFYSETIACGRQASGERFGFQRYASELEVYSGGSLIYREYNSFEPSGCDMEGLLMFGGYSHLLTAAAFGMELNEAAAMETAEAGGIELSVTQAECGCYVVKALGYTAQGLVRVAESLLQNGAEKPIRRSI